MDDDRKQELAFLYLHGELPAKEKPIVFELILQDEVFRRCLKEELEMREQWRGLRVKVPDNLYQSVLRDIRSEKAWLAREAQAFQVTQATQANQASQAPQADSGQLQAAPGVDSEPPWLAVSEKLLSMMMPTLLYPMIKHLQRRCFT